MFNLRKVLFYLHLIADQHNIALKKKCWHFNVNLKHSNSCSMINTIFYLSKLYEEYDDETRTIIVHRSEDHRIFISLRRNYIKIKKFVKNIYLICAWKLSLNNHALKIDGGRQKDKQTERQTDRKTDKACYRGASLLNTLQ